jgi:hypothetical protein
MSPTRGPLDGWQSAPLQSEVMEKRPFVQRLDHDEKGLIITTFCGAR